MPRRTATSVRTSAITGTVQTFRGKDLSERHITMVVVDHKGQRYYLAAVKSYYPISMANQTDGWRVVGDPEPSPRSKAATARKGKATMTAAEVAALDKMVLYVLRDYRPSRWLPTANALADDVFNNHNYSFSDVDTEKLTDAAFRLTYSKRTAASAVRASLVRLIKRGKVISMYGTGLRGREAKVYCLKEYDTP